MDPTLFDYFERLMICFTPIAVAWFGLRASKNEKQTKKYMESQQQLKEANDKLAAKEKEDLQKKLDSIGSSVEAMQKQIDGLEGKIASISIMDQKIGQLVGLTNINHEFSLSLSQLVLAIGDSLDSSVGINSGSLKTEIERHKNTERELSARTGKILY